VAQTFQAAADAALIDKLRRRDEDAVDELALVYGGRIHQLALRYLKNAEDAEEVTQDVLYKAVRKIDAFRGDSALSSWLYRITFNAAMSRLRHLRVARHTENPADVLTEPGGEWNAPDIADWSDMADEAVLRGQLRRRLMKAVRRLPPIYRAPIILRDLQGLSTEEASSRLRVNGQTLKSRLHRGRLMLRRQLSDFADGLALHRGLTPVASRG
jgi:RNA polymerase sigma-70 factor (ECF subfamily)